MDINSNLFLKKKTKNNNPFTIKIDWAKNSYLLLSTGGTSYFVQR
jgi:hypothetical protein